MKKETQAAGQTVKQDKRSKLSQSNEQTPLTSCELFGQRANYHCACHPHHWDIEGLPRQCPLCRRPQSTIDANDRRHLSKPPFEATFDAHHRSHPSTPPNVATNQSISDNPPALFTLGHHHSPNQRTHQLLLHFDNTNPSRTSGSAINPGLFRRRAQLVFHGWNLSISLLNFLTQNFEATKATEARAINVVVPRSQRSHRSIHRRHRSHHHLRRSHRKPPSTPIKPPSTPSKPS